jgi:hypothetical protein
MPSANNERVYIIDELGLDYRAKKIQYIVEKDTNCWKCISHRITPEGYPLLGRKPRRANRYIYTLYKGEIPEGMFVRHKCDNPSCINPDHLELGTPAENSKDMVERNRSLKGSSSPQAKLTEEDVLQIRRKAKNTHYKEIAQEYSVNEYTIRMIIYGKIWKHVEGEITPPIPHGRQNIKVTKQEADKIKLEYALLNISQAKLAKKYNISQTTIWRVINEKVDY